MYSKLTTQREMDLHRSLQDVLNRFKSCIGAGDGKIEGDENAIAQAEALLSQQLVFTHCYTVRGSHAEFSIDKYGNILERNVFGPDSEDGRHMAAITRFDTAEREAHYGAAPKCYPLIDILDIGYTYASVSAFGGFRYAAPEDDWRKFWASLAVAEFGENKTESREISIVKGE